MELISEKKLLMFVNWLSRSLFPQPDPTARPDGGHAAQHPGQRSATCSSSAWFSRHQAHLREGSSCGLTTDCSAWGFIQYSGWALWGCANCFGDRPWVSWARAYRAASSGYHGPELWYSESRWNVWRSEWQEHAHPEKVKKCAGTKNIPQWKESPQSRRAPSTQKA